MLQMMLYLSIPVLIVLRNSSHEILKNKNITAVSIYQYGVQSHNYTGCCGVDVIIYFFFFLLHVVLLDGAGRARVQVGDGQV